MTKRVYFLMILGFILIIIGLMMIICEQNQAPKFRYYPQRPLFAFK